MGSSPLTGRRVRILANDFISQDLAAHIACVSESGRKILLQLDSPLIISSKTYTHAVASPRLAKNHSSDLMESGTLGCSVIWVPKGQFNHNRSFDLSWWRGGAAAITDVVID